VLSIVHDEREARSALWIIPILMLAGGPKATRRALARAELSLGDVDLFEVNESFAAVPLHYARELGVGSAHLSPHGGAIALGHPLGATGVVLAGTLLEGLERGDGDIGVISISICAGAGIASAMVLQRLRP
jgi:acetyl-CoA C-acetyltransferase